MIDIRIPRIILETQNMYKHWRHNEHMKPDPWNLTDDDFEKAIARKWGEVRHNHS